MIQIDQIIRTTRKTIAIIVRQDGTLVVRAPQKVAKAKILAFVEEKADWIRAKQAEARTRQSELTSPRFVEGETFLYLGEPHPLKFVDRPGASLTLVNGTFEISCREEAAAKTLFFFWYQNHAREVLNERVKLNAERFHLTYSHVQISSARTRWGSCSSKGALRLSWRLVMAPLDVIDYVVIHELAHTLEHNHSARFWEKVAAMQPDYARHVKWLKQNGRRLSLD